MTNQDPTLPIGLGNEDRQTQKTGFINNSNFVYHNRTQLDQVELSRGDTVINTTIDYPVTEQYVMFKLSVVEFGFKVSEHVGMYSAYTYTDPVTQVVTPNKLRITLPVVNSQQVTIPEAGVWTVGLYTIRDEERVPLSKALKPRASFPEADY